jgi:hypothetical protein
MWQHLAVDRIQADVLALQAKAELAGCALGCAYMSTAEFEAAVIRSKRGRRLRSAAPLALRARCRRCGGGACGFCHFDLIPIVIMRDARSVALRRDPGLDPSQNHHVAVLVL